MKWYLDLAAVWLGPAAIVLVTLWLLRRPYPDYSSIVAADIDAGALSDDDLVEDPFSDDADRLALIDCATRVEAQRATDTAGLFRELLVLWPAWMDIVSHVSRDEPLHADPQSVYGAACASDRDRLAARLYAGDIGDTLEDGRAILDEVLAMAMAGVRPRCGVEMGLTASMFQPRPSDGEAA